MDEMNSKYIEQGWQCPVCKAVMSPRERMCVNCRGMNLYGKVTTFPETEIYYDVNKLSQIVSNDNSVINNLGKEFDKAFDEIMCKTR